MKDKKNKKDKKIYRFRHKLLSLLVSPFLKIYLRFKINFKAKNIKLPKGPLLVVSNHVTTYDQFYVPMVLPKPLYPVAMDDITSRKGSGNFVRWGFGTIPKLKGISDFQCVRTMIKYKNEGLNLMIYPEANRTYDGLTCYIDESTTKLIKSFKIPVVFLNIIGGYGVDPRWGKSFRKGYHTIKLRYIMPKEEVQSLSNEELQDKIKEYLTVDNYDPKYTYKGKDKAEYLERFLYTCPDCHSVSHLHTSGDDIYCDVCGYKERYKEDLTFDLIHGKNHVLRVDDWAKIDKKYITSINPTENLDEVIFTDEHINVYQVYKTIPRELKIEDATLIGYKDRFVLKYGNTERVISFDEIVAACPVGKCRATFYLKENGYQIEGVQTLNAFKYVNLFYHHYNYKKGVVGMDEFLGI